MATSKKLRTTDELLVTYEKAQLFNHAVVAYSNLWYRKDRRYKRDAMASDFASLAKTLHEISADYKVTRTLFKKGSEKWTTLAEHVLDLGAIDNDNYIGIVTDLAVDFARDEKKPLSAASKLLWFRCGWPIKIYDSRAVAGLKALGYKPGNRNYEKFCSAWTLAFNEHHQELEDAVDRVGKNLKFTLVPAVAHGEYAELAPTPVFVERAFDQYLWLIGDPKDEMS